MYNQLYVNKGKTMFNNEANTCVHHLSDLQRARSYYREHTTPNAEPPNTDFHGLAQQHLLLLFAHVQIMLYIYTV